MKVDTESLQGGQSCYRELKSGSQAVGNSPGVSYVLFVELLGFIFSEIDI